MTNKKVLITGSTGFIGNRLASHLHRQGWTVTGTIRPSSYQDLTSLSSTDIFDSYQTYALGDTLSDDILATFDAIIHLAHDFLDITGQNNIDGTLSLVNQAKHVGLTKQIFISSYSSRFDATTSYAKTKYAIESRLDKDITILRPGLVVGDSGLFGRIHSFVKGFFLVPKIGYGFKQIPIVDVDDLCEAISINLDRANPVNQDLFQPTLVTFDELVKSLSRHLSKNRLVLPLPATLILGVIKLLKLLRINPPISEDNVQAFVQNQSTKSNNNWSEYTFKEKTLADLISKHF